MLILLGPLLIVLGVLVGCGQPGASSTGEPDRIPVLATTAMIGDLAQQIGGEYVDVEVLMGPGVDPHLYKAAPSDVAKFQRARLVLAHGLHLEGKLRPALTSLERSRPVVFVAEQLPEDRLLSAGGEEMDPHVWFDVSLWAEACTIIGDALAKADPPRAAEYQRRADKLRETLLELHEEMKSELANVPPERRVLVTAHDAFQYFGRTYGFEVRGIQGMSTESEAGLKEVNDLVAMLVRDRIPAVFIESSVSPKNVQALIEGAKANGHPVRLGGELFSDAMGPRGTPGGTYIGMVRENVKTIVEALKRPADAGVPR